MPPKKTIEIDEKLLEVLIKLAAMEPTVDRIVKFMDNGILQKRIQKAVSDGIEMCPYGQRFREHGAVQMFKRWMVNVLIPVAASLLTTFITLKVAGVI